MRIDILTGGRIPGLNPSIKVVVTQATDEGHEDMGPCGGWTARLDIDRTARK